MLQKPCKNEYARQAVHGNNYWRVWAKKSTSLRKYDE
jgi:hypothetical protein